MTFQKIIHQTIATSEADLSVTRSGMDGPTICLLHGGSFSSGIFHKQFEGGLAADHVLITIDLPGHGRSRRPKNPEKAYTLAGYAQAVAEAINASADGPVVLVGHSMGGHVLINALRHIPQAAGLMLVGTPPLEGLHSMPEAFLNPPEQACLFSPEITEQQRTAIAQLFSATPSPSLTERICKAIEASDPKARQVIGEWITAGKEIENEVALLEDWGGPVALIHGALDPFINALYIRRLDLPNIWRGEVQWFRDAGHSLFLERPAAFERLVRQFVEDVMP